MKEFLLVCWILYVIVMTVMSWFGPTVDSFLDFIISLFVAWILAALPAVIGN